ncbi:phage regulatory CII family protein [Arcobacter sp. F2176]|uniref:phage regulatory CII family protein n=1 Tax=Arcobacter sp. F2176 TaxID=2044511 RepID=UPI00100AF4BA|nr:phage regulatory CII family protein [Arcobacter sp. F2176]RXJ82635.1 hypothetical protein CRU95_00800 [Arcobacter sp. F2176]
MTNTFLNTINYSIEKFCDSLGFNKTYFHQFLNCSQKQAPKFLNPNDDLKQLKVIDLISILDNLDTKHRKIILDNLCQKYDFVCLDSAITQSNNISLEHILLNITSTNGELSSNFLQALEDGNISHDENKLLKEIAYKFRSLLRIFEFKINGISND